MQHSLVLRCIILNFLSIFFIKVRGVGTPELMTHTLHANSIMFSLRTYQINTMRLPRNGMRSSMFIGKYILIYFSHIFTPKALFFTGVFGGLFGVVPAVIG
jgi:hypothetical protein